MSTNVSTKIRNILFYSFCVVINLLYLTAHGAETIAKNSNQVLPLFQSIEPLKLSISAPFNTIQKHRGKERPYYPAMLKLSDSNGNETQLALKIRVRGKYRAKREICAYPPLKLNFKRKMVANTVFAGQNTLKLAVQCRNLSSYEQYLLLEYLDYRVYRLFTDYSLRVRLVYIDYYDSERQRDLGTMAGFFIEDERKLAKKSDMKIVKVKKISPGDYDPATINLVEVFEFFIGNTDWSAYAGQGDEDCCHNIIPLRHKLNPVIPVPYDFDLSGVVDTPYAVVNEALPIRNVRQRLYRGLCRSDGILKATLAAFIDKRKEIRALYENLPELSARYRKKALDYYDDFYSSIRDEKKLKYAILDKCR